MSLAPECIIRAAWPYIYSYKCTPRNTYGMTFAYTICPRTFMGIRVVWTLICPNRAGMSPFTHAVCITGTFSSTPIYTRWINHVCFPNVSHAAWTLRTCSLPSRRLQRTCFPVFVNAAWIIRTCSPPSNHARRSKCTCIPPMNHTRIKLADWLIWLIVAL